jgi:gliding motility-associated-like protein
MLTDNCTVIPDSAIASVNVRDALSVQLPSDTTLCAGYPLLVNAGASGGLGVYKYYWNGVFTTNPTVFNQSNSDTVFIVKITDGCSSPAIDTMKIHRQVSPDVKFSFSEISNCFNALYHFSDESLYTPGSVFTWNFGDGNFSTDSIVSHRFTSSGKYDVVLSIVSSIGCRDSSSQVVDVHVKPGVIADFMASSFDVNILDPHVDFYTLSGDSLKHRWIFGTGVTSSSFYPSYTFNDTGWYQVTLIVQNLAGCRDTVSKWVRVEDSYRLYMPNAFTPNNDGLNDVFVAKGGGVKEFTMYIFDRGGNIVFGSNDMKKGWDGKIANDTLWPSEDVLYYVVRAVDSSGQSHEYNGTVTVLR